MHNMEIACAGRCEEEINTQNMSRAVGLNKHMNRDHVVENATWCCLSGSLWEAIAPC